MVGDLWKPAGPHTCVGRIVTSDHFRITSCLGHLTRISDMRTTLRMTNLRQEIWFNSSTTRWKIFSMTWNSFKTLLCRWKQDWRKVACWKGLALKTLKDMLITETMIPPSTQSLTNVSFQLRTWGAAQRWCPVWQLSQLIWSGGASFFNIIIQSENWLACFSHNFWI